MSTIAVEQAREILGDSVLGLDEVRGCLGDGAIAGLAAADLDAASHVPFTPTDLAAGARAGAFLVFRVAAHRSEPLSILRLGSLLADALDPRGHSGVGYALRDEWTLATQPFATDDTPTPGWALVCKAPLADTCNKTRLLQDAVLNSLPPGPRPSRRSAVEIVYDALVWRAARGERLLADAWDWSRSESTDGGYAAVGAFGPAGLRIVAYSTAVRFGSLGVCPQR